MRPLEPEIYKQIENTLYNYPKLLKGLFPELLPQVKAVQIALEYFGESTHGMMMTEYYFKAKSVSAKYTRGHYHNHVCYNILFLDPSMGYVLRREVIYRVAMVGASLGLYNFIATKKAP